MLGGFLWEEIENMDLSMIDLTFLNANANLGSYYPQCLLEFHNPTKICLKIL